MLLNEIKSKVSLLNITMTELSCQIGVERRLMYLKIKAQDYIVIERIKHALLKAETIENES
ncbi:MAG: hypothetical protein ACRCXY_02160 [Fusobacteriaceae bacterium]